MKKLLQRWNIFNKKEDRNQIAAINPETNEARIAGGKILKPEEYRKNKRF